MRSGLTATCPIDVLLLHFSSQSRESSGSLAWAADPSYLFVASPFVGDQSLA